MSSFGALCHFGPCRRRRRQPRQRALTRRKTNIMGGRRQASLSFLSGECQQIKLSRRKPPGPWTPSPQTCGVHEPRAATISRYQAGSCTESDYGWIGSNQAYHVLGISLSHGGCLKHGKVTSNLPRCPLHGCRSHDENTQIPRW